ncbi:MAG TPA: GDP-mannose 4,6-dehydratase [Gemmatimonadaceae bacterium]|nr:GDP-mannose 4,6-dehydratase [Gemmatimonadaceae bacterium]
MSRRSPGQALVTGAAGFAGQWLCRDLARHGWHVTGTSLEAPPESGILSDEDRSAITWIRQDLRHAAALPLALATSKPDAIFHLAGVSHVPAAGLDAMHTCSVNTGVAVRLLETVGERRAAGAIDPVVLVIGSGEQYGRHETIAMPLGEEAECRPSSLYAATKLAQEVFALEAYRADGTRVICTRSFNHSGRGQAEQFLLPSLVARALRIKAGSAASLEVGNTDSVRDFLHVEDAVRAYVRLVEDGIPGEVYNVCSGEGVTVGDLAAEVLRAVGVAAELAPTAVLRRRSDVPILIGRNRKLCVDTGWKSRHTRLDIISDLIDAASH